MARYPSDPEANHDPAELPVHELALRLALFALEVMSIQVASVLFLLQSFVSALLPHNKLLIPNGVHFKQD